MLLLNRRRTAGLAFLLIVIILIQLFSFDTKVVNLRMTEADSGYLHTSSIEELSGPVMEKSVDQKLPEDVANGMLGTLQEKDTARMGSYQYFGRHLLARILLAVWLLFLLLKISFHVTLKRFCSRTIKLWERICYIHRTDGKKGKDVSVRMG